MQKSKEKGITLVALVITIVMLLILASIGINSGTSAIETANFSKFKNELKIIQTKVNELNEINETEIGKKELTTEQISIINTNIQNTTDEIIEGFRYCSKIYIKDELGLEDVNRDYLINVKYRYVILNEGYEYKGKIYYMINQLEDGAYNVEYNNKNPEEGDFDVNFVKESDRWKIEITNISYDGYISNWKVEYRASEDEDWKTANGLIFYVGKQGYYYVRVSHDNIKLGSKLINISDESQESDELQENQDNL